ncbi:hypothetical protein MKW98_025180, partial [Papaver atlanticum]
RRGTGFALPFMLLKIKNKSSYVEQSSGENVPFILCFHGQVSVHSHQFSM